MFKLPACGCNLTSLTYMLLKLKVWTYMVQVIILDTHTLMILWRHVVLIVVDCILLVIK